MRTVDLRQAPSGPTTGIEIPTTTDDLQNTSTVLGGTGTDTDALNSLQAQIGAIPAPPDLTPYLNRKAPVIVQQVISAQTNNYDPTNFGTYDLLGIVPAGPDPSRTITGFAAPGPGDNRFFDLVNTGPGSILILAHESASSSVNNRIAAPGEEDLNLEYLQGVRLWYATFLPKWVVVGSGPSPI